MALPLTHRLRRLRRTPTLRALVRETRLSPDQLVYPLFVCEGEGVRREVGSMPGVFQLSVDEAVAEARAARADGVAGVLLFGLPSGTVVASIGPVTAEAAQQLGITSTIVPTEYTVAGLVKALVEHFRRG